MEERIINLKNKIKELQDWKGQLMRVQIPYPMGINTKRIVRANRMVLIPQQSLAPIYDTSIEVTFKGIKFWISASTDV